MTRFTTRHLAFPLLLLAALSALVAGADEPAKPAKDKKHTNRLAREMSPYLLQHAHNPVDWFPWGEEAFAKAKKENKLVFLSIGYSSCHWCHVMERESFENEAVAKILNDNFVCIKVDREERPDIDHIYMTALNIQGQRGGWPLSMFLTAEGKPIVGGTYWPPDDKEGDGQTIRGFKTILKTIQEFHKNNAKDMEQQATQLADRTAEALAGAERGAALLDLDRDMVTNATSVLQGEFDRQHGGFGSVTRQFKGTKFPMPPSLLLLQTEAARTKSKELDEIVQITLDHMARGGIYDQLGGGFHRYSTERTWTVPHFEKMLYDNAQLLEVYARAFRETKKPQYKRVLQQTIAFIDREMTSPDGVFYSALDADADGEEGRFYVWTAKEIDEILGKNDAVLFRKIYGADDKPNFEGKYYILLVPDPLEQHRVAELLKTPQDKFEERLTGLRKKLFDVRAERVPPFLDTKVLTAWNGQMIAGLAQAGVALDDKKVIETAARAADFVLKNLRTKEGRLYRTYGAAPNQKPEARLNAYLDDYAFLVHGLLCLHDATGEARWLDEAKALTDVMVKFHGDRTGGFFYTSNDHEKLFARAKDQYDGAQPCGNSVAAKNLTRLWLKTGDERYAKFAERTLKGLATPLRTNPGSLTALAEALSLYLDAQKPKRE